MKGGRSHILPASSGVSQIGNGAGEGMEGTLKCCEGDDMTPSGRGTGFLRATFCSLGVGLPRCPFPCHLGACFRGKEALLEAPLDGLVGW